MSIRIYFLLIGIVFFIGIEGKPLSTGKISERVNYLLNITEVEKKFNNVLDAYLTSDPSMSIYKSQIMAFINKFLSFQLLRPHIVEIYSDVYTLAEINAMIKFYSTPIGKKLVEKEAKAEIRLTQLVRNQLQKQMPQVIAWFQEEMNKDYSKSQVNKAIQSIL
jgi:hypothetical protein